MTQRLDKYIKLVEKPNPDHKTRIWNVCLVADGEVVGRISWYGGWRKYVFRYDRTEAGFYDSDFMRMMADFCEEQTLKHYGKI